MAEDPRGLRELPDTALTEALVGGGLPGFREPPPAALEVAASTFLALLTQPEGGLDDRARRTREEFVRRAGERLGLTVVEQVAEVAQSAITEEVAPEIT